MILPVCGLSLKLFNLTETLDARFTVPVACAVAPPPLNEIRGTLVYPLPASCTVTAASLPDVVSILAVAVAVCPPGFDGGSIVTVGADV